jgi:exopolyphosphatase
LFIILIFDLLLQVYHDVVFLPVLDIPAADFPLRTEIFFAFSKHGISPSSLTFNDQINFEELRTTKDVKISLVDHNVLKHEYKSLDPLVVEVIDRREPEKPASDS